MVINLGQLAAQEGGTDEARARFREALALEPKLAIAHFNLATMAFRQKDYETTLKELAAVEASPLFESEANLLKALVEQAQTGKPRLDLLGQVCSASGRMWSLARHYPLALAAAGKPQRAYEDLLRQLTGRPYRAEAWRALGQLAEQMQQIPVAARAYGEAANRDMRDAVSRERLEALRSGL
jgi:tetratricopeptide (TPR) repeat protein